MKEALGDIWRVGARYILIPTNGDRKMNGSLIMGAGIALDAAIRYPRLLEEWGRWVKSVDNVPCASHVDEGLALISFPTKRHRREPSSIALIKQSAIHVVERLPEWGYRDGEAIALPRVGCGLGKLQWPDVKAVLDPIFDDRFTVYTLPEGE